MVFGDDSDSLRFAFLLSLSFSCHLNPTFRWDDGQFSEPIMYRNLYVDYYKKFVGPNAVSRIQKGGGKRGSSREYSCWLDENCVSGSRIQQFTSLVAEIGEKFT